METDPKVWIAVLRRSHDRLDQAVAAMSTDDLARTSGARAWDVSHVLGHLGSGAEIGQDVFQASLEGREVPPDANQRVWDRWNAMTRDERAEAFRRSDDAQIAALEALDDETLETARITFPFLPMPVDVAMAVSLRLSEHALHSWDVYVASAPAATLAPDAAELLVERSPMMAGFVGRADAWRGEPVVLAVTTTDPKRQFWLELGESVHLGVDERPSNGRLELPAEALVRLIAGRLTADRTPSSVGIEGPVSLDDLRAVFPGY